MKYEIVKKSKDNYTLKYKDKEFDFKTDVSLARDMQNVNKTARVKMLKELSKEGVSLKEFSIEEQKDGKTYVDNTNKVELEQVFYEEAMVEFVNSLCERLFGMTYEDLLLDIGFTETDEKEIEKFGIDLLSTIAGKEENTPSGKK